MEKRWLLGLVGMLLLISYVFWLPIGFYLSPNYTADITVKVSWFVWLILTLIPYVAIVRRTRPKEEQISKTHTLEFVKQKEVIIKVRCQYCNTAFDETLDKCPNCGAKR